MKFKDYRTSYDEFKREANSSKNRGVDVAKALGMKDVSVEEIYKYELRRAKDKKQIFASKRLLSELGWYKEKRPFFNVYPCIEKKLMELSLDIRLCDLTLPFVSLEIRTATKTFLCSDFGHSFFCTVDFTNGDYQEFEFNKTEKLSNVIGREIVIQEETYIAPAKSETLTQKQFDECIYIAAGVAMLAKDKSVVTPVILNESRKSTMTDEEWEKYRLKAIKRTGRIGFDVGRELEKSRASVHYRNGHFARFHVGKDHECYPDGCKLKLAPIIKWRCGSIVNKDNHPQVPTGFKGEEEAL